MKTRFLILLLILFAVLSSCKKDACDGISCKNGGTCENGECLCPTGYTGADCSQRVVPSSITITSIGITQFPPTNTSGSSWALTNGADVYPILSTGGLQIETSQSNAVLNAINPPLSFNTNWVMYKSPEQFCIEVYDRDDFDADDYMGGVCFNPFDENIEGFPANISLSCPSCTVAFNLTVDYDF
jgi:EGF-like domain